MASKIQKKLDYLCEEFIKHDKRFLDHNGKFKTIDQVLDEHTKQLAKHDKRFEKLHENTNKSEKRFDRLVLMVLKNQEDIKEIRQTMATKKDIRGIHTVLDEILGYVKKHDQELVFMGRRIRRLEGFHGI